MKEKMRIGRPPTNPVERIRVKILMTAINMQNQSLKTGYQLERYFNPERLTYIDGETKRSGKWDHYRKKGTTPSSSVLKSIKKEYPWAYALYESKIWTTLQCGHQSKYYWSEFYLSCDPELQRLCYRFKSYNAGDFLKFKSKKRIALNKLFKIGTLDALACLIALLRESIEDESPFEYDAIETTVFNLIFWIIGEAPFFHHIKELYQFLVDYIFVSDNHQFRLLRSTPWSLTKNEIGIRISINNKNIMLAEDISLISTREETRKFIYWKHKGDSRLIVKEMADAFYQNKYAIPDSKHGLKWLIKKLNKTRQADQQLSRVYI